MKRHTSSTGVQLAALLLALIVAAGGGTAATGQNPAPQDRVRVEEQPEASSQGHVEAAPSADDQAATQLKSIVAGLMGTEEKIRSFHVSTRYESVFHFRAPGGGPPPKGLIEHDAVSSERTADVSWEITRDDGGRMEESVTSTHVRSDGTQAVMKEERIAVCNGSSSTTLVTIHKDADGNELHRSSRLTSPVYTHPSPFDITTHYLGTPVSQLIADGDAKALGRRQWEGREVVVIEVPPVTVRADYIYKRIFWIDPERNIVVRRQSLEQRGPDKPWRLHYVVDTLGHTEVSPGIWLPRAAQVWNWAAQEDGSRRLVGADRITFRKWSVNAEIDPERLKIPEYLTGEG